jgi:excisionase family DNA binding protein
MGESLITTSEAAVLLRKSQRTVQRLADKGDLPNVRRLPNGHYLFDLEVVQAKAAQLEVGPVEELDLGLSTRRLAGLWLNLRSVAGLCQRIGRRPLLPPGRPLKRRGPASMAVPVPVLGFRSPVRARRPVSQQP